MSTTDIREALVELVDVIKTGKRSILHGMTGRETGFLMEALHKANTALSALLASKEAEAGAPSDLQLVWVQNLIGFIKGQFPADDRWKSIFVEKLSALSTVPTGMVLDERERMLLGWMLAAFEQSKVGQKITDDLKREMRDANRLVARLSAARAFASQDEGEERK